MRVGGTGSGRDDDGHLAAAAMAEAAGAWWVEAGDDGRGSDG